VKHTIALAALVATTIGFAAVPAMAQDSAGPVAVKSDRHIHRIARDAGPGRGAGFLNLVCSDRGAEKLEVALVRLSHRLDLNADQITLFDTFKSTALTTQTSFADDCATALPDKAADAKPDLLDRLKAGLALEQARLEALNTVLPDFEAFYGSLTEAQKADLFPRRMMLRFDDRGGADRPDRSGPDRPLRAPAPGRG
jgi:hypothetical protein